jgi:hypothetical protein
MIFNEELWQFLFKRYGGHCIQRYYTRKNGMFYTSVEARLKNLHVRYLNTKLLYEGSYTASMFK